MQGLPGPSRTPDTYNFDFDMSGLQPLKVGGGACSRGFTLGYDVAAPLVLLDADRRSRNPIAKPDSETR